MRERIERGVRWLDEEHPGWVDRIDLDKLHMPLANRCILGQGVNPDLYDHLYDTEGEDWLVAHGFDISTEGCDRGQEVQGFAALEQEWTDYITQRRSA